MQKLSHDMWCKTLDAVEATMVLEKYLNQAHLDLHALGSTGVDLPPLLLAGEPLPRQGGKTHQEDEGPPN